MKQANATYSTKEWDRRPWGSQPADEGSGIKLGRIEMIRSYQGDIEGEGTLQYLFAYNKDNEGGFVALEKVQGRIGDRSGSFMLQCMGTIANDRLKQTLLVIPGSGTGELAGLKGQATIESDLHMDQYPLVFDYEF